MSSAQKKLSHLGNCKEPKRNISNAAISSTPPSETVWEETARSLRELPIQTLDQAVEAVIDAVCNRMQTPASSKTELRAFLLDLFETDPELKENIRGVFKV